MRVKVNWDWGWEGVNLCGGDHGDKGVRHSGNRAHGVREHRVRRNLRALPVCKGTRGTDKGQGWGFGLE